MVCTSPVCLWDLHFRVPPGDHLFPLAPGVLLAQDPLHPQARPNTARKANIKMIFLKILRIPVTQVAQCGQDRHDDRQAPIESVRIKGVYCMRSELTSGPSLPLSPGNPPLPSTPYT